MKPHIKYGLHSGAAFILINLAYTMLMNSPLGGSFLLSILVFAAAQYFALREWRHNLNGLLSFNKAFGYSMLTALIGSVIYAVYSYINLKFLNHSIWLSFKLDIINKIMSQPIPKGVTATELEGYLHRFIAPAVVATAGILGSMITGMMTGIFVSLALKQEDPFNNERKY